MGKFCHSTVHMFTPFPYQDEVDSLRTALTKERGEKKKEKERVKEEFAMELESAKAQAHASKGTADELRKLKWEFQVLKDETSSDKKQLSLTLDAEKVLRV